MTHDRIQRHTFVTTVTNTRKFITYLKDYHILKNGHSSMDYSDGFLLYSFFWWGDTTLEEAMDLSQDRLRNE